MKRIAIMFALCGALALPFAGCGSEEEPAGGGGGGGGGGGTEPAMEESGGGGGGGGACAKARRCCEAYVTAVGAGVTVDQACAGIAAAEGAPNADMACNNMVSTWRQSLQTMNKTVPSDCSE